MILHALIPCERVIFEQTTNSPSLISVIGEMRAQVPEKEDIPSNAVAPKQWSVYCMWLTEDGEVGNRYTQITRILWPDGTEFARGDVPLSADKRITHNAMVMTGFPIGRLGLITIEVWLESGGKMVGEKHFYKHLNVAHERIKVPEAMPQ